MYHYDITKTSVLLTITGREVVDLLVFFLVDCGVPGSFSTCALAIILTG